MKRGAAIEYAEVQSPHDLLKKADYLVVKIGEGTPQWIKNLTMAWKNEGKHGTVVR